jgi:hypothetical protein
MVEIDTVHPGGTAFISDIPETNPSPADIDKMIDTLFVLAHGKKSAFHGAKPRESPPFGIFLHCLPPLYLCPVFIKI